MTRRVSPALAAFAFLFLVAHVPFLPDSLEDVDSVNFALGVQDFDVARHQPHPPGYPVYVGLGKVSAPLLGGAEDPDAVLRVLALWSVIAGTSLVPLVFSLFRAIGAGEGRAWSAAVLTAACPLFWFTAVRPLSDMAGLAAAVAAQALVAPVLAGLAGGGADRRLIAAAAMAGLAAGIRVQTVMLTAPLLLGAFLARGRVSGRGRALAALAAAAACLLWVVPLLAANGGLAGYLAALGTQAGEDFSGVVMLWTSRSPRVAAAALVNSFIWPWGTAMLGVVVVSLAAFGALRVAMLERRSLALLFLAFAPYAAFHLLFHETVTIRYALPLVVPIAFLCAAALDTGGARVRFAATAVLAAALLAVAFPAVRAYGSAAAPAVRALRDSRSGSAAALPLATHAVFRRTVEWELLQGRGGTAAQERLLTLRAPHGREWLSLVEWWKVQPSGSVALVADPARTDLALFDPQARELRGSHRWPFAERPYVGGVRPRAADWYLMRPPGWMLDRGWALSAEIGGVTARDGAGPHVRPSVAWVRERPDAALMLLGGRNLGGGRATMAVTHDGRTLDSWEVDPGFFIRRLPLSAGTISGDGYAPLAITVTAPSTIPVALEQFDLQPEGVPMFAYAEGWQEPEYNPALAIAWRWAAERSVLWVRPVGRDVILTIAGESPLRYFDAAPTVRLSAAGQEIARFSPAHDFAYEARVPAGLLERTGGELVLESDRWFVPAAHGGADERHLALRIYRVAVR